MKNGRFSSEQHTAIFGPRGGSYRPNPLALGVGVAVLALAAAPASAFRIDFNDPEIDAYLDSTVTVSTAMRTQSAKHPTFSASGNWNVFNDAGDIYSTPFTYLGEFGISKGDYGFFTRFKYLYDYTLKTRPLTSSGLCMVEMPPPMMLLSPQLITCLPTRADSARSPSVQLPNTKASSTENLLAASWAPSGTPSRVPPGVRPKQLSQSLEFRV